MVRTKPSQFTKSELEDMVTALGGAAGIDFVTGGALNKYSRSAALKLLGFVTSGAWRIGATVAPSVAGSVGRAAIPLITNPYIAGTALGYGALQTEQGQQLLAAAAQSGADTRRSLDMALFNTQAMAEYKVKGAVKRTKSKFNKAISKGMSVVKASTSYGVKGVISTPRTAFKSVVSVASGINKKRKAPKSGIRRKIYLGIKGILS